MEKGSGDDLAGTIPYNTCTPCHNVQRGISQYELAVELNYSNWITFPVF